MSHKFIIYNILAVNAVAGLYSINDVPHNTVGIHSLRKYRTHLCRQTTQF